MYEMIRLASIICGKTQDVEGYFVAEVGSDSRIAREDMAGLICKPYNPAQLQEMLKSVINGIH